MSDESSVRRAICTWASRNTCLLLKLSSVSEAHSDLESHLNYVSRLHQSVSVQTCKLEQLREEVGKSLKAYKSFRGFAAHRFLYRTAQTQERYEAKALRAEQKYFAALAAQIKAQERLEQHENHYKKAIKALGPLEQAVQEHDRIRDEIDQLYEELFGGPTPGFPHEDEREEAFKAAKAQNDEMKERVWKSREAVRLLNLAQQRLLQAQKLLENAQKLAGQILLFSNSMRPWNERLTVALAAIRASEQYLPRLSHGMLASKQSLLVQLETAKRNPDMRLSSDVMLSVIMSAKNFLLDAEAKLKELIEVAKQGERNALSDFNNTAKQLEDARQELQLFREEIFEKVAGFGIAAPAYNYRQTAPEYAAIVDRGHEPELGAHTGGECSSRNTVSGLEPPEYLERETIIDSAPARNMSEKGEIAI